MGGMLSGLSMAAKKKVSKKKLAQKEQALAGGAGDGAEPKTSKRDEKRALDAMWEEIERVGVGFECSAEDSQRVNELCREVESYMSITNSARSSRLWGSWRLRFTDSPAMLKNRGVTGLGSVPFTGFVELTQTLRSNGTAVTEEVLTVPPFGKESRSYLRGQVVQVAPEVIEQTYVEVSMGGFFNSNSGDVGGDVFFSKAVLAIAYLSENLRICRTRSDHVFVFERAAYE
uniref:Plastid lipid-associated protein/fibrillin conserved domain-containing protein n=1 Tax=Hemiselmis tepida TaxID=464990 RepID=A0A7S0VTA1_9CRYP